MDSSYPDGNTEAEIAAAAKEEEVQPLIPKDGERGLDERDEEDSAVLEETEQLRNEVNVLVGDRAGPGKLESSVVQEAGGVQEKEPRSTLAFLETLRERLNNPPDDKEDEVIFNCLSELPHAKENCKGVLDTLKTAVPSTADLKEQMEAAKQKQDYMEAFNLSEKLRARAARGGARGEAREYITDVYIRVSKIHSTLRTMASFSQAEAPVQSGSKRTHSEMYTDSDYNVDRQHIGAVIEPGRLDAPPEEKDLHEFNGVDGGTNAIDDIGSLAPDCKRALQGFSKRLNEFLDRGTVFTSNVPEKNEWNASLDRLSGLLTGSNNSSELNGHTLIIPGPIVDEEKYTQPFLHVLLESLGSVLDGGIPSTDSPTKADIKKNRRILPTEHRHKSISANGHYVFIFRDDAIELPAEEKAGERQGQKPLSVLHQCEMQLLSTLAKQVGVGLNFACRGVDTKATGIVLTLAYVKIIQLRLENMTTVNAGLVCLKTKCLPLLSKKVFEKWTKDRADSWNDLKNELYPPGAPGEEEQTVPKGIVALSVLMTTRRKDLVGPASFKSSENKLGDMISFGAFAVVHRHQRVDTQVIKLSRYGAKSLLSNEISMLKELGKTHTGFSHLVSGAMMKVNLGGVDVEMPALVTEPYGMRVEMAMKTFGGRDTAAFIKTIGADMLSAIEFIHKKGLRHNDVSPRNILFVAATRKAFLIDFGLSSKVDQSIKGFRGTPRYVHRSIFRKYPKVAWNSMPAYDHTSLAFSMAAFLNEGKALWKNYQPCTLKKENGSEGAFLKWANNRSEAASLKLQNAGFEKKWVDWCDDSSTTAG